MADACTAQPTATNDPALRNLFGIPVAAIRMAEVLDRIHAAIAARQPLLLGVVNAAKVVNMQRDAELRESVLSSDLILADGIAVVWASKLLGKSLPERVTGIDLMHGMLHRGQTEGYRVFCLGATQEVLDAVVQRIAQDYPGVIVAGSHHGYFGPDDEPGIARLIHDAHADILLVAMTSPKKERFLARWNDEMNVPVCHGVGGSFDVMAGKVRRAPRIWQKLGMEWLYRVLQEPGRLWRRYLVTNTLFAWLTLREMARPTRSARP